MYTMIKKHYLILLVLLSLAIRLGILACTYHHPERAFRNPDAYLYDRIAQNVLKYQTFSGGTGNGANFLRLSFEHVPGLPETNLIPDSFRTPGYPVFLAAIYGMFGRNIPAVIGFQIILSLLTSLVVYKIGVTAFNKAVGIIAFLLITINLELLAYPNYLLTETLFMFLLTTSVWFFVEYLKREKVVYFFLSALFVGLSTLCKPAGQYFPFIFFLVFLIKFRKNLKMFFAYSLIFVGIFLLVVSPWLVRNYRVFGHAKISSMQGYDLFLHRVAFLEGEKNGGSYEDYEEARIKFVGELQNIIDEQQLNSMEASIVAEKLGKQRLLAEPLPYIRSHIKGMIRIFVGHSLKTVYKTITDEPYESGSALSMFLETKDFKKAIAALLDPSKPLAMIVLLIMFTRLVCYLALLYGCFRALKTRPLYLFLFILILGYFTAVIGPYGVEPRFRTQIIPALTILISYGLFESLKLFGLFKSSRR